VVVKHRFLLLLVERQGVQVARVAVVVGVFVLAQGQLLLYCLLARG
jgi:hypothetical protein